jgi:hypothetical protein
MAVFYSWQKDFKRSAMYMQNIIKHKSSCASPSLIKTEKNALVFFAR